MAGEIVIPIGLWSHRVNNANGVWTHAPQTVNAHMPKAWRLSHLEAVDLNGGIVVPIPADIAATPAAKVRIRWSTPSPDTSSVVRFFVKARDVQPNVDSLDGAWDDEVYADDTSIGQYVMNEVEVALSAVVASVGRDVRLLIRRDAPGTAADTLAAIAYLHEAFLIADKA